MRIFDKIFYSFYRIEEYLYPYSKKGGYSGGIMLEMFMQFEIGIALLLAALSAFLFCPNDGSTILTIFTVLVVCYFLLLMWLRKRIWKEPSEEELQKYKKDGTNVIGWFIFGLVLVIFSFLFMLASILLLIKISG